MNPEQMATYILIAIAIVVAIRLLIKPLKWLLLGIFHSIICSAVVLIINSIGGICGAQVGLNFLTATVLGVLSIPGVGLLYLCKIIGGN